MESCRPNYVQVFKFLAEYNWVYNFQMTNFFEDKVWENIPNEWCDVLLSLDTEDINNLPFGEIKDEWPDSVKSFIRTALTFSLPRKPLPRLSPVVIDPQQKRGMSPKKQHEVSLMSSVVHDVARQAKCDVILDIGSGLGYLGQTLHQLFGYKIIGFESQLSHTSGAERRSHGQVQHRGIQNVTFELEKGCQNIDTFTELVYNLCSSGEQSDETFEGTHDRSVKGIYKRHEDTDAWTNTGTHRAEDEQTKGTHGGSLGRKSDENPDKAKERTCEGSKGRLQEETMEVTHGTIKVDPEFSMNPEFVNKICEKCRSQCIADNEVLKRCSDIPVDNYCRYNERIHNVTQLCEVCNSYSPETSVPIKTSKVIQKDRRCTICDDSKIKPANLTLRQPLGISERCHGSQTGGDINMSDTESQCVKNSIDSPAAEKQSDVQVVMTAKASLTLTRPLTLPRALMIGLHCCGDLTPTMMEYFRRLGFVRGLCCVSCCYHRMEAENRSHCPHNFPRSTPAQSAYRRVRADNPGWNLSTFAMRLAAQETRGRWKHQTADDHVYHTRNVGYRGILELYTHTKSLSCGKLFRRIARKADFSSFPSYVEAVSCRLGNQSGISPEVDMAEISELFEKHKDKMAYIEPITALQYLLQPVLEGLLHTDRADYLQEHGIKAEIVPIFDEVISPRNLALISVKDH